jgi:hypothetical protein
VSVSYGNKKILQLHTLTNHCKRFVPQSSTLWSHTALAPTSKSRMSRIIPHAARFGINQWSTDGIWRFRRYLTSPAQISYWSTGTTWARLINSSTEMCQLVWEYQYFGRLVCLRPKSLVRAYVLSRRGKWHVVFLDYNSGSVSGFRIFHRNVSSRYSSILHAADLMYRENQI